MSTEHEDNLRDLAAMFAMAGLVMRNDKNTVSLESVIEQSFLLADKFMETRTLQPGGIVGIKRRRKKSEDTE
jgi:hypothetical protein